MRILGIHDGHNASACIYNDGRIEAMVSEERFSRKKNHSGFPDLAVQWLVNEYGVAADNIDLVAVAGLVEPMQEFGKHAGPWYRMASIMAKFLPSKIRTSGALAKSYLALRAFGGSRNKSLGRRLAIYDIPESKIKLVDHHTCHAHAAYWLDYRRTPGSTLIITLDNTGDGICGSVSIAEDSGKFRTIKSYQSLNSVGMMYTAITTYLGLKALEDEHKVMGLAPYAKSIQVESLSRMLMRYLNLTDDGLGFVNKAGLWGETYTKRFQKELVGFRFDAIAGGVQRYLENIATNFLKAWSRKTGIRKLALGGGVFMNVKLNMLINETEEFEEVYFLPSCSDESIAAGAALKCAFDLHRSAGKKFNPEPVRTLYLGPEFSERDVAAALQKYDGRLQWKKCEDIERKTAELLAQNYVVGRFSGRMEFGARALGNRSILARPDSLNNVRRINAAIKQRDFWMPFCSSVLWERRHDYIANNHKDSLAPYMILAFQSTELARKELIAALHPSDLSCRPQIVERDWNPKYHRLIQHFEELTKIGGVLNTSFNLHGYPVVCTPEDAIETYLQSDLDVVTLEDYMAWDSNRLDKDSAVFSEH